MKKRYIYQPEDLAGITIYRRNEQPKNSDEEKSKPKGSQTPR